MSNAILSFGNLTDTGTVAGGSWNAAFPLSNLQTRLIGTIARSTDATAASTTFVLSLPATSFIGALSLEGTNVTTAAQVRWRTYSDAALTALVYDSGVINVYTGSPAAAGVARFQKGIRHVPSIRTYAQYVKCEVFDTANPDGYFESGRLFVGDAFQPKVNMIYGTSIQLKPLSVTAKSINGVKYGISRRPNVVFPFTFNQMSETEAQTALDIQAQVDITGEVLFVWDLSDTDNLYRKSVFGELLQLDTLQYPNYAYRSMAFQIEGAL